MSSRSCWPPSVRSSCSEARCSASVWSPWARPRSSSGFAFVVGKAVGSDLLHGTAPLVLLGRVCSGWFSATPSTPGSMPPPARWPSARTRSRRSLSRSACRSSSATSTPSRRRARATRASSSRCWPTCRRRHRSPCRSSSGLDQVHWWQFLISVVLAIAGTVGHGMVRRRHLPTCRAQARVSGSACGTCGGGPRRPRPKSTPTVDPA